MTKCEEVVEGLKIKVNEYEGMLKKILDAEKFIAKVDAGPQIQGDVQFWRVTLGNSQKVVSYSPTLLFGDDPQLSVDDEVIISGDSIIAVLPKMLGIPKEKISLTKLINWDEIGGMKSQITKIRNAVEGPMKHQNLASELGISPIKGIVLYGPPGCGKTLIGKAIAKTILSEEEVEPEAFVYMKGAEVLSPYVGVAEALIRNTFADSRKYTQRTGKRAVIMIDEAEAILPRRGSRHSSDVDSTIVPAFLAEMDGFDDFSPLVLLATNKPDSLDDAVIRPGRIDMRIEIARPTREDIDEIFEIHTRKVKLADALDDIKNVGGMLLFSNPTRQSVSGAMVEALVKLAAVSALARKVADSSCVLGINVEDLKESYSSLSTLNPQLNEGRQDGSKRIQISG